MAFIKNNQRRYAIAQQDDYLTPSRKLMQLVLRDTPGSNFVNYSVRVQKAAEGFPKTWDTVHDSDRRMEFEPQPVCIQTFLQIILEKGPQLPAFTYFEQIGIEHDVLYPSCVIDKLEIWQTPGQSLSTAVHFQGSGKRISPSGIDYAVQVEPFKMRRPIAYASLIFDAGIDTKIDDFSFEILRPFNSPENYGTAIYQVDGNPSSGQVRAELLSHPTSAKLTFNAPTSFELLEASAVSFNLDNGLDELSIKCKCELDKTPIGLDQNLFQLQLSDLIFDPRSSW